MSNTPQVGDYVLATRWQDGDPKDPWVVGFVSHTTFDKVYIVDEKGSLMNIGGFRRAKKISQERGDFILKNKSFIEYGNHSVWYYARVSMKGIINEL